MKTRIIEQTIEFKDTTPEELFDIYTDPKKHAAAIGAPASISRKIGSTFAAFGEGHLVGEILHVVPNRMVVQTWRAQTEWKESWLDSVLILTFEKISGGAKITLVQSGVPERTFDKFSKGWNENY